jgi:hypothetical protein
MPVLFFPVLSLAFVLVKWWFVIIIIKFLYILVKL